jgi:hypothetical protein
VTPEIDLAKLTVAQKDALILSLLPLVGQLEAALARIAELEARLARLEKPPKTPDNSSVPPSKGQKYNDQPTAKKPPRKSRPGFGRALDPNPDRVVECRLHACPHCAAVWAAEPQTPQQVYDRIELPPVRPDVTRPADHRSRAKRWRDTVTELVSLQAQYTAWLEALPESLQDSSLANALHVICDLDLSELEAIEPPRGFGRDK